MQLDGKYTVSAGKCASVRLTCNLVNSKPDRGTVICVLRLEGIYFHAITYSDIRGCIGTVAGIFYLAPLFLWLLSILFAVLVFSPKVYHTNIASGRESKETFIDIVTKKHKKLKISQTIFFLSFIFLLIAMALYLW